jgi:hypothetical protein
MVLEGRKLVGWVGGGVLGKFGEWMSWEVA